MTRELGEQIRETIPAGQTAKLGDVARVLGRRWVDIEEAVYDDEALDLLIGVQVGSAFRRLPRPLWEIEHVEAD